MQFGDYMRFLVALIFVLALLGVFAWLIRRFELGGRLTARRGQGRRIGIVEVTAIDSKRRMVLVRRDRTEHLLLLGGNTDVVIERGIQANPDSEPVVTGEQV